MVAVANVRNGSTRLIARSSILYVQSNGDFVRIVTDDGRYLLRATLNEIERRWEPSGSSRVHRQYVANLPKRRRAAPAAGRNRGARVRWRPDDPDRPPAHGGAGTPPGRLGARSVQLWSSCPRPRTRARMLLLRPRPEGRDLLLLFLGQALRHVLAASLLRRLAPGRGSGRRPPGWRACDFADVGEVRDPGDHPAHDLARTGLRHVGHDPHVLGSRDLADVLARSASATFFAILSASLRCRGLSETYISTTLPRVSSTTGTAAASATSST